MTRIKITESVDARDARLAKEARASEITPAIQDEIDNNEIRTFTLVTTCKPRCNNCWEECEGKEYHIVGRFVICKSCLIKAKGE